MWFVFRLRRKTNHLSPFARAKRAIKTHIDLKQGITSIKMKLPKKSFF
ncbi:MAG: hypothetical protein U5L45_06375 [Saprospiraceae bacterium]|nr:hypothetical protein [Saprospiraceae bacterium]